MSENGTYQLNQLSESPLHSFIVYYRLLYLVERKIAKRTSLLRFEDRSRNILLRMRIGEQVGHSACDIGGAKGAQLIVVWLLEVLLDIKQGEPP
jgi:hypothetical protein